MIAAATPSGRACIARTIRIDENRGGPGLLDAGDRWNTCVGGRDHLVAGADADGLEGDRDRVGARGDADRMRGSALGGEIALEALDRLAERRSGRESSTSATASSSSVADGRDVAREIEERDARHGAQ